MFGLCRPTRTKNQHCLVKLLFDQNISYRLISKISASYPKAKQTKLGLTDYSDKKIWDFAKANGYTIITFDSDFFDLNTYYGFPPKIIWLRTGNMTSNYLAKFLLDKHKQIADFIKDEHLGCLQLILDND